MIKHDLKKPLIMAHAGGMGHGRENSVTAIKKTLKYNKADIFELDVRKSKDGILYCYHGFGIIRFLAANLLKYITFAKIKKIVKVNTLQELVKTITKPKIIFLDIKQSNISAEDIEKTFKNTKHEVWLGGFSLEYMKKLKKKLGEKYAYIYNFSFFNFEKNFKKMQKYKLDAFQIFPWQCSKERIKRIKKAGIKHIIAPIIVSPETFIELVKTYGSLWICLDDMTKPTKFTSLKDYFKAYI